MKKIGSGWTYNVYDIGNNKVLKTKKSYFLRALRIISSDPRELFKIKKTIKKLDIEDKLSFTTVFNLKNTTFDFATLGNPEVVRYGRYKQDFCKPVYLFLSDKDFIKKVIDDYIEQIRYFWSYGFADTVYNFTINNAIDKNGKIVLIDFNEITADKQRIIDSIEKQIWNKRFSVNNHLDKDQKQYFKQKMSEEITKENLEKLWCSKINEKDNI